MGMYSASRDAEDVDCQKADDGMTRQEFKDDCDINIIVARYEKTGMVDALERKGFFGDVSSLVGWKSALDKVQAGYSLFYDLDAKVRERFDNDPEQLINFLNDDKNRAEAIELGIVNPPPPASNSNVPPPLTVDVGTK